MSTLGFTPDLISNPKSEVLALPLANTVGELRIFPSLPIYLLLRLMSWNLTTLCSAVLAVVVLVSAAD